LRFHFALARNSTFFPEKRLFPLTTGKAPTTDDRFRGRKNGQTELLSASYHLARKLLRLLADSFIRPRCMTEKGNHSHYFVVLIMMMEPILNPAILKTARRQSILE